MSEYFPKPNLLGANKRVEIDLYNNATKTNLKNATVVDTSSFAKNWFSKFEISCRWIRHW